MKHVANQRGNAAIFLLWLLGIVAIIFLLTINLVKVYAVKEQANLAVEQAAYAGTAVLLEKTKSAVKEFDTGFTLDPLYIADREAQRLADLGKSVGLLIEERKVALESSGKAEAFAYIQAADEILPERLARHPFLKKELKESLNDIGYTSAIMDALKDNGARMEDTVIVFSEDDWRVEVKSTVRFESISDHKFIEELIKDIPQVGYGPSLHYLENVYE